MSRLDKKNLAALAVGVLGALGLGACAAGLPSEKANVGSAVGESSASPAVPAPEFQSGFPRVAGNTLMVLWLPVGEAKAYRVYLDGKEVGRTESLALTVAMPTSPGAHRVELVGLLKGGTQTARRVWAFETKTLEAPDKISVARSFGSAGLPVNTLTWDTRGDALATNILRAETEDGPYSGIGSSAARSFTDGGIDPQKSYYYRLTVIDAEGRQSAVSSTVLSLPMVDAVSVSSRDGKTAEVRWNPLPGFSRYKVFLGGAEIGDVAAPPLASPLPEKPGEHLFRVAVVDHRGEAGPLSLPARALAGQLATPTSAHWRVSTSGPQLEWKRTAGALSYHVYRSAEEPDAPFQRIGTVDRAKCLDDSAKPGVAYRYRVTAVGISQVESLPADVLPPQPPGPGVQNGQILRVFWKTGFPVRLATGTTLLAWDAIPGVGAFRVLRSVDGGEFLPLAESKTSNFEDTEALPRKTLTYRVAPLIAGKDFSPPTDADATVPARAESQGN